MMMQISSFAPVHQDDSMTAVESAYPWLSSSEDELLSQLAALEQENCALKLHLGLIGTQIIEQRIHDLVEINSSLIAAKEQLIDASSLSSLLSQDSFPLSDAISWNDMARPPKPTRSFGPGASRGELASSSGAQTKSNDRNKSSYNHSDEINGHPLFTESCIIELGKDIRSGDRKPNDDPMQPAEISFHFTQGPISDVTGKLCEFSLPDGQVPLALVDREHLNHMFPTVGSMIEDVLFLRFSSTNTYACCLITADVDMHPEPRLVAYLDDMEKRETAARIITIFFRCVLNYKTKAPTEVFRDFSRSYISESQYADFTQCSAKRTLRSVQSSLLNMIGFDPIKRKIESMFKIPAANITTALQSPFVMFARPCVVSKADLETSQVDQFETYTEDDFDVDPIFGEGASMSRNFLESVEHDTQYSMRPVSLKRLREAGREGQNRCVVSQKVYCILSDHSSYPLLLKAILELWVIDRKHGDLHREEIEAFYISYLSKLRAANAPILRTYLSRGTSSSLASDSHRAKHSEKCSHLISFAYGPPDSQGNRMQFSSPSNGISRELFHLAILLNKLNSDVIIWLINLLILEKSIVVIGSSRSWVATITCALAELLVPLRWEGIFIPLVPFSAREVMCAPVPLLVGLVKYPQLEESLKDLEVAVLDIDSAESNCLTINGGQLVASPPLVTMIEDEAVGYYAHQIRHEIRHGSAGQTCKCPRISSQEFSSQKPADIVPTIDTVRWDNNYTLLCFHILYHLSTRTLVLLNDAWRAIEKRNARLLGDLHGLEWSPSYISASVLSKEAKIVSDFRSQVYQKQHFHTYMNRMNAKREILMSAMQLLSAWIYLKLWKRARKQKLES